MDLKIKDVAELLNVSEITVRRWLAARKIPAYRINRQYRFNRDEIEDWVMRQKLGFGRWEKRQKEPRPEPVKQGNMQFSLYRALYRGEVLADAVGKTKEEIIKKTMEEMANHFELDPGVLTDLLLDREQMMSTALGHGIAVPHTRDFLLDTHYDVVITVYPKQPIAYGSLDGEPVHTLFFLFASEDKHHLHLLAKLAHLSSDEERRAFFRTKPSKEHLLEFVKKWESSLSI